MQTLIHKQVGERLNRIATEPGGSYLVIGPEASGKFTATLELAQSISQNPGNILVIEPAGRSIGIDQIHGLTQQLNLKSIGGSQRVVIIRDADLLTVEAQNAFLKNLEEPPVTTTVVLTAATRTKLLPTIISRCQIVRFLPVTTEEISNWLVKSEHLPNSKATDIAQLSRGIAGTAKLLATDKQVLEDNQNLHKLTKELLDAKADLYQKLQLLNQIESKFEPTDIINALVSAIKSRLRSLDGSDNSKWRFWHRRLKLCHQLLRYLSANGNAKLALTQLALGL